MCSFAHGGKRFTERRALPRFDLYHGTIFREENVSRCLEEVGFSLANVEVAVGENVEYS